MRETVKDITAFNKPNLAGEFVADFETAGSAVSTFSPLEAVNSELAVADDVNFFGLGAGGGGRLFIAVDETAI